MHNEGGRNFRDFLDFASIFNINANYRNNFAAPILVRLWLIFPHSVNLVGSFFQQYSDF